MIFDRPCLSCSIAGSENMTETFIVSKYESPSRHDQDWLRHRRTLVTWFRQQQTQYTYFTFFSLYSLLPVLHFPVFPVQWVDDAGGCGHVFTWSASVRERGVTVR